MSAYHGNRKWHSSKRMTALEINSLQAQRFKDSNNEPPTQKQLIMLKLFEEIAKYYKIPCEKTMERAYSNRAEAQHACRVLGDAFDRKGLSKEKIKAMYFKRLKTTMDCNEDLQRGV